MSGERRALRASAPAAWSDAFGPDDDDKSVVGAELELELELAMLCIGRKSNTNARSICCVKLS